MKQLQAFLFFFFFFSSCSFFFFFFRYMWFQGHKNVRDIGLYASFIAAMMTTLPF